MIMDKFSMQVDISHTPEYREAEALYVAMRRPGSGTISDASELRVSPDGGHAVFTGAIVDTLEGVAQTRVCRVDLATGETNVLTYGPNTDRLPRYSPNGQRVAFLSDRLQSA